MRIPEEILTDDLVEDIKTRCCFVGEVLNARQSPSSLDAMDLDLVSTETVSGVTAPQSPRSEHNGSAATTEGGYQQGLERLASLYRKHSNATDMALRVMPPVAHITEAGTGPQARGTIIIPGWIRERAAEVLFEGGDVDERSVVEIVLDILLKVRRRCVVHLYISAIFQVPVDLRKEMASSILVVGGTPMLPGFVHRLHAELLHSLSSHSVPVNPPSKCPGYSTY